MESLYRKYRPLTFESVVGQQHIVSTLEHAVAEGRLSHAYLFCGPRGTGKTTMARILAKALLCEKAEGARAAGATGCNPDGPCPECTAIAEGTHPDVYELDAASRTGVDNVREEIINSVSFAPVRGAYKVYIIDEVHMLTTQAFNALLKTLEEPPSHVIFVLCTTTRRRSRSWRATPAAACATPCPRWSSSRCSATVRCASTTRAPCWARWRPRCCPSLPARWRCATPWACSASFGLRLTRAMTYRSSRAT